MKKKYFIGSLFADFFIAGLVPLNLFFVEFSEFFNMLGIIIILSILILFFIKGNGKLLSKLILSFVAIGFSVFMLACSYCNPYWNSYLFKEYEYSNDYDYMLTQEQAIEDIECMMNHVKKVHPMFINSVPAIFEDKYTQSLKNIKTYDALSIAVLQRELQSILSSLEDAHTYTFTNFEQYHYLKYIKKLNDAGYNLYAVNGVKIEELFMQKSYLYSFEVDEWGIYNFRNDITTLEGLIFLGFDIVNGIKYSYTDKLGNVSTNVCYESDFLAYEEYVKFNNIIETNLNSFVEYSIYPDNSLCVLTLHNCKYNQEYIDCLKEMFTHIKEQGIKNVAVDIRNNGGGSSFVIDEFIRYLDVDEFKICTSKLRAGMFMLDLGNTTSKNKRYSDLTFNGKLYVLTSTNTFSSAMMFAQYITDNNLGTLIGESPANIPGGYGEIAKFLLPNSKIYVAVSSKQFFRADKQTADLLITPDIVCNSEDAVDILLKNIS